MRTGNLLLLAAVFSITAGARPPENDTCADSKPIFEGYTAFSTLTATTDGAPHPLCNSKSSNQVTRDIWFHHIATSNTLSIGLCGSTFDTRLAVYKGTDCPPNSWDLLACNDDGCGTQSKMTITTTPGECYTIRVGGFANSAGQGFVSLNSGCIGCGCQVQGDCCEPHGQPYCNNPDCCSTVCIMDPHCCNVGWDQQCVSIAEDVCIAYCTPGHAGDTNGDGQSDVDDLLLVINSWGPCPRCTICDADLNGDNVIDVDDLLAVINHWSK